MSRVALGEFEHHVMLALQRLAGRFLEFRYNRGTVRATTQPLERQHDVVLEFTECDATHWAPSRVQSSSASMVPGLVGRKTLWFARSRGAARLTTCNRLVTYGPWTALPLRSPIPLGGRS